MELRSTVYSFIHNLDASKLKVQTDCDLRLSSSAAVACFRYLTREGNAFVFYIQLLFLVSDWAETTNEVLR